MTGNERLEREGHNDFWWCSPVLCESSRRLNGNETNVVLMRSESHCTNMRTSTAIICLIPCVHLMPLGHSGQVHHEGAIGAMAMVLFHARSIFTFFSLAQ